MMNTVFADTNYSQPTFSLEFNIYGTGAEILLNDIPVYYHDAQGQTISQKPVPESIVDGENVLTVRSFPLDDDDGQYQKEAHIEAIISVREKDGLPNEGKPLLQIKLNPTNDADCLLEGSVAEYGDKEAAVLDHTEKQTIAERRTAIQSPFPRWAWQDGQVIEDTPENFDSLLAVYKEIWGALNEGDKARVRALYDPAAQEFALAYHYQDKKHGHRIMNTGGLIGDGDWKLGSMDNFLNKFNYGLDIISNGKIVRILDQKQRSPIVYLSRKAKIISIQKFGFYKNKAGEWVMIR
jgi:hypothetical protein